MTRVSKKTINNACVHAHLCLEPCTSPSWNWEQRGVGLFRTGKLYEWENVLKQMWAFQQDKDVSNKAK